MDSVYELTHILGKDKSLAQRQSDRKQKARATRALWERLYLVSHELTGCV